MKFGKHLLSYQVPEWSSYYISYKNLKGVIKTTEVTNAQQGSSFFFALDRELEKVNSFHQMKVSEVQARFNVLAKQEKQTVFSGDRVGASYLLSAYRQLQDELHKLQNFVELNSTGFRKILKKYDKKLQRTTQERYLKSKVMVSSFHDTQSLVRLNDEVEDKIMVLQNMLGSQESKSQRSGLSMENYDPSVGVIDPTQRLVSTFNSDDVNLMEDILTKAAELTDGDNRKEVTETMERLIHRASREGYVKSLGKLADLGALQAVGERVSQEAFMEAIGDGQKDVVEFFIQHMNPRIENSQRRSALHLAVLAEKPDILELLLEHVADQINVTDYAGMTPLLYAANTTECVEILIRHGADVNARSPINEQSLLLIAAEASNLATVRALLKSADLAVNATDEAGQSALHLAARTGAIQVLDLLLEHKIDMEIQDKLRKWTALFLAASEGKVECVRSLLAKGAVAALVDIHRWSPRTHALYRGYGEIARELANACPPDFLSTEAAYGENDANDDDGDGSGGPKNDISSLGKGVTAENHSLGDPGHPDHLDAIPPLELPPPVIPFKHYGHTYLRDELQLRISLEKETLDGLDAGLRSVGLNRGGAQPAIYMQLSVKKSSNLPYNVLLPAENVSEVFMFSAKREDDLQVQMDVMQTYGDRIIGRGFVMGTNLADGLGKMAVPIVSRDLNIAAKFEFNYCIVSSLPDNLLKMPGTANTYWKSKKVLDSRARDGSNVAEIVTATSLHPVYITMCVEMDDRQGNASVIPSVSLDDLLRNNAAKLEQMQIEDEAVNAVHQHRFGDRAACETALSFLSRLRSQLGPRVPLEDLLKIWSGDIPLHIVVTNQKSQRSQFTGKQMNAFVDKLIVACRDHMPARGVMFSSNDTTMCTMLALKQPLYPVFFITDFGLGENTTAGEAALSMQAAVNFAKSIDLLGIIGRWDVIAPSPVLYSVIHESSLMFIVSLSKNDSNTELLRRLSNQGIDGISSGSLLYINDRLTSTDNVAGPSKIRV
eukprot:Clim_evm143s147 gene=Clim_evmTU143s147